MTGNVASASPGAGTPDHRLLGFGRPNWQAAAIVALCVTASCLTGIITRPPGFLAALWPANAVLLALFMRLPSSASLPGILAAAASYVLVDLYLGSSVAHTALLNAGNMVSVLASFFAWKAFAGDRSFLEAPNAALGLIVACGVGSAAAGLVGAPTDHILFDGSYWRGWTYWFATEFSNYMIFLPVLLTARPTRETFASLRSHPLRQACGHTAPALAVALSVVLSIAFEGPGALAFPIPALLWAALTYTVSATALLAMLLSLWFGFSVSSGDFLGIAPTDQKAQASLRLGISLIALFPVALSLVMRDRNELLARLRHSATHDALTGVLNAEAFRSAARTAMRTGQPFAFLALDIDHFKQINDHHGHAAGDLALATFAEAIGRELGPDDLFGRLGGEEFALLAAGRTREQADAFAERIREAIKAPVSFADGVVLTMTVSIGLVAWQGGPALSPDDVLREADLLLYQAKRNGRDRVETPPDAAEPR
jgi:diguanylate cyclase (GGDEF)-like protein